MFFQFSFFLWKSPLLHISSFCFFHWPTWISTAVCTVWMFSTVKPIVCLSLPHSPGLLALIPTVPWAPCQVFLVQIPSVLSISCLPWCGQLGDKECLCCAGVSSCVPSFFLAAFRWAGTLSTEYTLLALPVFRLLKEFLLSGPLKIFTILDIFASPILCWSSADELECVGGKMVRKDDCVHVNLIFLWNQAKKKVQSTWMCENKQVTLCTWLV